MKMKYVLLLLLGMILFPFATLAGQPDDAAALEGVERGKVVFDINNSSASSLNLYLAVIRETHDDLVRQGVEPDILLAFRGPAVTLVSTDRERLLLDGIEPVGNTFVSLIGYQARGYAVIPIY